MESYSLIISGLALVVSSFVAGWTVYRDAIQKLRFRVTAAVKSIIRQGHEPVGDSVSFVFPINESFPVDEFSQFGVSDGYGTVHWATRKNTAKAVQAAKNKLSKAK